MTCYCGNDLSYANCCEPFHLYHQTPAQALQLMRSRYSAYVLKNAAYILDTYGIEEQKEHTEADILAFANAVEFIRLQIVTADQPDVVEFKAFYLAENKLGVVHERSTFALEGTRWKYITGELFAHPEQKVSRNDPCPCLSGKKFKQCHLR
ncbi:YchJ family protein [Pseudoalteromonas fenneropenaei]|uniref:YchJ family protein n=1 Tax=Pseudoalteromonas fenneropenaei TaxID=1737459 RepID=A0ABV7CIH2_9GAMM